MIGNDIIDLELARKQSNWQRKGLIEKLFDATEIELIFDSAQPEILFWSLWSRKEAAYKIYNRSTKIRAFNPKQFRCDKPFFSDGVWLAHVVADDQSYWVRTQINSSNIYSEAVLKLQDFDNVRDVSPVDIYKDSYGIPYHKISENPISITHHGVFEKRIQLERQIESRFQFQE